jgi:hypothetical protein
MKRLIAAAAIGLVAVALYAVTASGTPQAVTPRQFAALSKKVTTLTKTVNSLKKDLATVETCAFDAAIPVARFGNPDGNEGYVYQNPDNSLELQIALDVSTAQAAQGWFLSTSATCANAINGGKKTASFGAAHR